MPTQTGNGKGFEFACLQAMIHSLSHQDIEIITNAAYDTARGYYLCSSEQQRKNWDLAANAAIRVLKRMEPRLEYPEEDNPLFVCIQTDDRGRAGDVRDILAIRRQKQWEIGISAKNNHFAVKHSRLSQNIDFGREWLGIPSSTHYFEEIKPYFEELGNHKKEGILWSSIPDKAQTFYVPILSAFIKEIERLVNKYPNENIPSKLLSYLLGRNDFYKVISNETARETIIQGFSLHGTLNKPSGKISPQIKIPELKLPKEFYTIRFKPNSDNTILIVCDEGWTIQARIHNASSKVEPSLKFDIKLGGHPSGLYVHHELWD